MALNRRPKLNDPALESSLERDGYALVERFLSAEDIEELLAAFRALESPVHQRSYAASMMSTDLAYRAEVDRAIKNVFTRRSTALLGGYRFCFANFLVKARQVDDQGYVRLHQDPSLVDEEQYESLALWVPLVDTDLTNGCLSVIPGSHRFNRGPRGSGTPFPYNDLTILDSHLRPLPIKAGTAMIFSGKLFHTSLPNRGTAPRVVAGAVIAPRDAQLRCYWPDPALPGKLAVYEVDDLFYTRYLYGTRPEGSRTAVVDYWYEPLDTARLAQR